LAKVFEHAKRGFEKGDHDYAHDLLTQCVSEDPGNLATLQHFRANVAKAAPAAKRGPSLGGLLGKSARGVVDKPAGKGAWQDALAAGCNALKKNAADVGVLQAMAAVLGGLGHAECQLYCLRWALDTNATDPQTNRQAAAALAGIGQFDQAIACWQRVQQQQPADEEAAKQIARLSVEKTIHQGGYDPALLKPASKPGPAGADGAAPPKAARVADLAAKQGDGTPRTPQPAGAGDGPTEDFDAKRQRLEAAIAADPSTPEPFIELADLFIGHERWQDAERWLTKGLAAARDPGSTLRGALEGMCVQRAQRQVDVARGRVEAAGGDAKKHAEAKKLLTRMVDQANRVELEVYTARVGRSPGDARLQLELGLRQKRLGMHREAIKSFQAARADARRLAETQVLLGESFQHIEQYKLALSSYEAAVEATKASGAGDEAVRKLALYRAGVLATGMKDLDRAEQRLTELAALDFSYRDVAARLDKLAAMRNDA
ncbi:MAG: hypothetical protein AAF790_14270, partial [Planctomycetota bacterium]